VLGTWMFVASFVFNMERGVSFFENHVKGLCVRTGMTWHLHILWLFCRAHENGGADGVGFIILGFAFNVIVECLTIGAHT